MTQNIPILMPFDSVGQILFLNGYKMHRRHITGCVKRTYTIGTNMYRSYMIGQVKKRIKNECIKGKWQNRSKTIT